MVEFHGVGGAALRVGAKVGGVAEHLGKWDVGVDDLGEAAIGGLGDLATAG